MSWRAELGTGSQEPSPVGSDKPPTVCHICKEGVIHSLDLLPQVTEAVKAQPYAVVHIQSPSAQLTSKSMSMSSVLLLCSLTRVN